MTWRLAEAKNRFSEVFIAEGPQRIFRRHEVEVVLSRDYEKLAGKPPDFKQFLLSKGPTLEGLDLARDRSPMGDVKL